VIIGESDDFRPLAALGGPDGEAPLFSPREGGIDESLLHVQFSAGLQLRRQGTQDAFQFALSHPLLEAAVAGLVRRILVG